VPNLLDLLHELSIFTLLTMAVSIGAFGLGVSYAIQPTERKLMLMRPVSLAAIFATLSAVPAGWALILAGVAAAPSGQIDTQSFYRGVAETLTVGFVCFGFLSSAWLLVAVGMLRRGYGVPAIGDAT
jgi:hypothetical protein